MGKARAWPLSHFKKLESLHVAIATQYLHELCAGDDLFLPEDGVGLVHLFSGGR